MNRTGATRHAAEDELQRNGELLEAAFSRYQDELLGTLYYVVGNLEDAKDALQETFVKCWRHRSSVGEIENLRAWIFRIAVNAGRDMRSTAWKRHNKPLENEEATLVAQDPKPETNAARREQLEMIRRALLKLRPEEQEVFLLRQVCRLKKELTARLDLCY